MWILLKRYLTKFILYLLRKKSITWHPGERVERYYMKDSKKEQSINYYLEEFEMLIEKAKEELTPGAT